jgi:hypothetical protein
MSSLFLSGMAMVAGFGRLCKSFAAIRLPPYLCISIAIEAKKTACLGKTFAKRLTTFPIACRLQVMQLMRISA